MLTKNPEIGTYGIKLSIHVLGRIVLAICLCFAFLALFNPAISAELDASESLLTRADYFCGPRCIKQILESYSATSTSEDLYSLVQAIQREKNNVVLTGTTLEQLELVLNDRNIFTFATRLSASAVESLNWQYPVLLHLKSKHKPDGAMGHFVVWLPKTADDPARIWDGLNGASPVNYRNLDEEMTRAAVLTSPRPILASQLEAILESERGGIHSRLATPLSTFLIALLVALTSARFFGRPAS